MNKMQLMKNLEALNRVSGLMSMLVAEEPTTTAITDGIKVSELPVLPNTEEIEHHIVAKGDDLYRVDSPNHSYKPPHDLLHEKIQAGNNISITKNADTITIASTATTGGGTDVPEDFVERVEILEDEMDEVQADIEGVQGTLDRMSVYRMRLNTVEEPPTVVPPTPTPDPSKWFVLALGGQSNMTGYGEKDVLLINNPRIKQLARCDSSETDSSSTLVVDKRSTGYGDRFREFRPTDATNLTLIPATPCLDAVRNKFREAYNKGKVGGFVSPGLYYAEALLPYIPEEYGIVIVDGSNGSTGFSDMHAAGTYDSATKRCTDNARKWGVDLPIGKEFVERIQHVLSMNPENKLLPVVWCQGENDTDVEQHYTRCKEYFKHLRDTLFTSHPSAFPRGSKHDFRIVCMGTTKKHLTIKDNDVAMMGRSIYDNIEFRYESPPGAGDDPWGIHDFSNSRSNFDNYSFLMEDPELQNANKESEVVSVRCDIDQFGKFIETAQEEAHDTGEGPQIGYTADWHFSTNSVIHALPQMFLNAVANYCQIFVKPIPMSSPWTRPIRGKGGLVTTDNTRYIYDNSMESFSVTDGLLVHMDFAEESPSETNIQSKDLAYKTDTTLETKVATFDGTGSKHVTVRPDVLTDSSYTVTTAFKLNGDRETTGYLVSGSSTYWSLHVSLLNGGVFVQPELHGSEAATVFPNFMIHKSLHGGWHKQWNDWQYLTIVYDMDMKLCHTYLNGCLLETLHNVSPSSVRSFVLGRKQPNEADGFEGDISSFRIYDKVLNTKQVNRLYYLDLYRKLI